MAPPEPPAAPGEPAPAEPTRESLAAQLRVPLAVVLVAGALVGIVVLTTGLPGAVEVSRVAGDDRFDTAAQLASRSHPEGSEAVVLAAGGDFPDALAASALAGRLDAPILLVDEETPTVPAATARALRDLAPEQVHLVGGPAVLAEGFEPVVREFTGAQIVRHGGEDRFATAAVIAGGFDADDVATLDGARTALIVSGRDFADALAAGAPAAAGPLPILLSEAEELPAVTADALAALQIERVLVLGGEAVLGETVVEELAGLGTLADVQRVAGQDRYETATRLAQAISGLDAFAGEDGLVLAPGETFPDALATAPFAADLGAPLVPVPGELGDPARALIAERSGPLREIVIVGGQAVLAETLEDEVEAALGRD